MQSTNKYDSIEQYIADGGIMKNAFDINQDQINLLFDKSVSLYNAKEYQKAKDIMHALLMLDHLNDTYWKALGAIHFALREYRDALSAYSSSIMINYEIRSAILASKCCVKIDDKDSAIDFLKSAMKIAEDIGDENGLKECKELINNIQ